MITKYLNILGVLLCIVGTLIIKIMPVITVLLFSFATILYLYGKVLQLREENNVHQDKNVSLSLDNVQLKELVQLMNKSKDRLKRNSHTETLKRIDRNIEEGELREEHKLSFISCE